MQVFRLDKQGHTLGNLLAERLKEDDDVRFAAYNIPCPTGHDIKLRVEMSSRSRQTPVQAVQTAIRATIVDLSILHVSFAQQCQQHSRQVLN